MRNTPVSGRTTPSRASDVPQRPVAWDEKLDIARHVLGAYSWDDLLDKVLGHGARVVTIEHNGRKHEISSDELKRKFKDAMRNWSENRGESLPKKPEYHYCLDQFAIALGFEGDFKGYDLITSSLEAFCDRLPAALRTKLGAQRGSNKAMPIIPMSDAAAAPRPKLGAMPSVLVPHGGTFESIRAGLKKMQIDTAHYYLEAEAAESWNRLILAEEYPTYDQCKAGLNELMKREAWKTALNDANVRTAVMLAGGGAPTKDLVILRSLLKHAPASSRISMFLVDTSDFMLYTSFAWLNASLPAVPGHDRVDIQMVNDNVLNLSQCRATFRREGGGVLFAITGGTIGNLKEGGLFAAIERVAGQGDLLIISADTVDESAPEDNEHELIAKYKNEEMLAFIASGVGKVMRELKLKEPLEAVLDRVTPRFTPDASGFSDVPGSWSFRLVLPTESGEVTLVSSTRYTASHLIAFANAHGWVSICTVPAPSNTHYMQFAFRKTTERTGTTAVPSRAKKVG